MKKWEDFRFLACILVGGIIFACLMGYPKQFYDQYVLGKSQDNVNLVDADTLSKNGLGDGSVFSDGTVSGDDVENTADSQGADSVSEDSLVTYDFTTVDDTYFDDACFIGDSRVVSLYEYSGWSNADFYCSSGMALTQVFADPNSRVKDGNWKENIATSLQEHQYGKIYIMIGINDMGVGDLNYFYDHYSEMVKNIRTWQPDADIFLMGIMRVSSSRNAKGDYINNDAIDARNNLIAELADDHSIFYLDCNEVLCDETGALTEEYTFDGVHLLAKYVPIWTDYIKAHGIVK